jgi:hypothetical protein
LILRGSIQPCAFSLSSPDDPSASEQVTDSRDEHGSYHGIAATHSISFDRICKLLAI